MISYTILIVIFRAATDTVINIPGFGSRSDAAHQIKSLLRALENDGLINQHSKISTHVVEVMGDKHD